jgi:phage-related protein
MKPLRFVGSSYEELCAFPREVYRSVGRALMIAQLGEKAQNAKPLRGFVGAAVLEVIEDYQGDAYRAVYTVKLASAVYVLHCFQKKSPRGSQVPRLNQELILKRWRDAQRIEKESVR